ncbi:MAG: TRAP transporter small permease [Desulfuromonadales bacterium]
MNFFRTLDRLGKIIEDALLFLLLAGMILLATGQIALRNFFATGFVWGDELLRIILLWLALFGAMAASRDDKHINIDLFSRFLPRPLLVWVRSLLDLFTAAVCWIIAWHGLEFVRMEAEFGSRLLGRFPSWWFQSIIPVGFAVIGLRYCIFLLGRLANPPIREKS